ncbi:MAG: ATP-dependent Clp protease adaptor ClpS [Chloroflexota bacterium]
MALEYDSEFASEQELASISVETNLTLAGKVILYNDEWHTFEDVAGQILKAIGCTSEHAEYLTWEAHLSGSATVYEGELTDCLRVSSVLEEIALETRIEC